MRSSRSARRSVSSAGVGGAMSATEITVRSFRRTRSAEVLIARAHDRSAVAVVVAVGAVVELALQGVAGERRVDLAVVRVRAVAGRLRARARQLEIEMIAVDGSRERARAEREVQISAREALNLRDRR